MTTAVERTMATRSMGKDMGTVAMVMMSMETGMLMMERLAMDMTAAVEKIKATRSTATRRTAKAMDMLIAIMQMALAAAVVTEVRHNRRNLADVTSCESKN